MDKFLHSRHYKRTVRGPTWKETKEPAHRHFASTNRKPIIKNKRPFETGRYANLNKAFLFFQHNCWISLPCIASIRHRRSARYSPFFMSGGERPPLILFHGCDEEKRLSLIWGSLNIIFDLLSNFVKERKWKYFFKKKFENKKIVKRRDTLGFWWTAKISSA